MGDAYRSPPRGTARVIFGASFYEGGSRGWVIAPALFAIFAGVALGVNVAMGEEKLPRGLEGSTPFFGVALAVFVVLTVVAHFAIRVRVRVLSREEPARVELEIVDRARSQTVKIAQTSSAWHRERIETGRGSIPNTVLELAILDEERHCPVMLCEELGAAYDAPRNWAEGSLSVAPQRTLRASMGRVHLDELALEIERELTRTTSSR